MTGFSVLVDFACLTGGIQLLEHAVYDVDGGTGVSGEYFKGAEEPYLICRQFQRIVKNRNASDRSGPRPSGLPAEICR